MKKRIGVFLLVITSVLSIAANAFACKLKAEGSVGCDKRPTWTIKGVNDKNPDNTKADLLVRRTDPPKLFPVGTKVKVGESVSVSVKDPVIGKPGDVVSIKIWYTRINGKKITVIKDPVTASITLGDECPVTPPTTAPKPPTTNPPSKMRLIPPVTYNPPTPAQCSEITLPCTGPSQRTMQMFRYGFASVVIGIVLLGLVWKRRHYRPYGV